MRFNLNHYFRGLYYFQRSDFAHFLATSNEERQNLEKVVGAYYRLSMYETVGFYPPALGSASGLIASIVSHAACGNFNVSNELITIFEKNYSEAINDLIASLVSFDYKTCIKLVEKYNITSLLGISLMLKSSNKNIAIKMLDNYVPLSKEEYINYYLLKAQIETNQDIKLELINQIYKNNGLCELSYKKDIKKPQLNVNTVVPQYDCKVSESQKKVSILMTAFNSALYIESTIQSLLSQTYQNLEIIIVDDNSTDETWEVIEKLSQRDCRIKIFRQPFNTGTYCAKNFALQIAQGEFVMCHDADDWSHPQRIELQLSPLIKHIDLVATVSNWVRIANNGDIIARSIYPLSRLNSSSLMFRRREVMQKMGFWDIVRTGADSEFLHRIKLVFGRKAVKKINLPLSFGSHHIDSLMNAPDTGFVSQQIPVTRLNYWESWMKWHIQCVRDNTPLYIPIYLDNHQRKFDAPEQILIDSDVLEKFKQFYRF